MESQLVFTFCFCQGLCLIVVEASAFPVGFVFGVALVCVVV